MSADQEDRPPKRPRTVLDSSPQCSTALGSSFNLNTLKRHPEFWLDDGSIVLVARNTGFRVYRALLVAQSTVFADMFSSSSPNTESTRTLEGCPVVHLSDSPRDVAHLLRVLLPKDQPTFFSHKFRFTFHQISAIIRLAHKYSVQAVLDRALSALEDAFPSDFDAWENQEVPVVEFENEHAIGVISLASLVGRPSLLPVAFYRCALLGADVLDGYTRENRKVEHLDHLNTWRCIHGRNELASRAVGVLLDIFSVGPSEACEDRGVCSSQLESMLQMALRGERSMDADILRSRKSRIEWWAGDVDICEHCEKGLIDSDVRVRRRVWHALPGIFHIEEEVGEWDTSNFESDDGSDC